MDRAKRANNRRPNGEGFEGRGWPECHTSDYYWGSWDNPGIDRPLERADLSKVIKRRQRTATSVMGKIKGKGTDSAMSNTTTCSGQEVKLIGLEEEH